MKTILLAILIACSQTLFAKTEIPDKKPRIEVCFVLDTTGSMGGLIEGAKQKIWSIANEMISAKPTPELKLGLIGYRDKGDDYVVKSFPMTDDIDAIYAHLRGFEAAGGGDTPESVNEALAEELRRDPLVFLLGEDVAEAGHPFKVLSGLVDEFGTERVQRLTRAENVARMDELHAITQFSGPS